MIVTIDGPAGSGKSTAAIGLARRLGFEVLDTGAMYRAVALAVIRAGIVETDLNALDAVLGRIDIQMPSGQVILKGEDVSRAIREPAVSQMASRVAAIPAVRQFLVELQRKIADHRDMICEGRDQGTVVFPQAARKFFFLANPQERARRRLDDLRERGDRKTTLETVLAEQQQRDRRDASRDSGPMVPAQDAIIIDTTHLTPDQVLDRLEGEVRKVLDVAR